MTWKKEFVRYAIISFASLAAVGLLVNFGTVRGGEVFGAGGLRIESPWARATIGSARTGAVYMNRKNAGAEADRLVAIETPVAVKAHLHETVSERGVMKMLPVDDFALEPGESIMLAPGGLHIMLMKLAVPLKENQPFPLTLRFEKAGSVTLTVVVGGPGQMAAPE